MTESFDRRVMAAAIRLGASANGTTWPNPAVGSIIMKDGIVIARGRTARGGRPHGEVEALAVAGEGARGGTIYASLEPCSHQGRAPPCADAIVLAGVSRVVSAIVDPNPRVSGAGLERMRVAHLDVVNGLLADDAKRAHAGHFHRVENGRPYVLLKLAVSADDAIGREGEAQVQVTGEIARRHAQALRSRFDAILVGRGTVVTDDPELTVRLPGLEDRSPIRVVLDSEGRLAADRRVLAGGVPTWVLGAGAAGHDEGGVRRFTVPRAEGGLDLRACLSLLAEGKISRLLVEGGAELARNLLEADLVDEVMLFSSPNALGGKLVPALAGVPLSVIERSDRFRRIERRRFGIDMMSRYERAH